jgi:hypothetical protein
MKTTTQKIALLRSRVLNLDWNKATNEYDEAEKRAVLAMIKSGIEFEWKGANDTYHEWEHDPNPTNTIEKYTGLCLRPMP